LVNGKHFPVNRNTFRSKKTLSSQRKIWFGFQESVFLFGCVCFSENDFREITFQTFLCLFAIRKVGQQKILSSQRKNWLGFQESVFLENLGGKHFPEVVKKLEMSLFAYYIKFDPQTFDTIYNLFWIFIFQFHLLKFIFYINFGLYFYNCYLLFPYYFFIEIFYLSNFCPHSFDCYLFYLK